MRMDLTRNLPGGATPPTSPSLTTVASLATVAPVALAVLDPAVRLAW